MDKHKQLKIEAIILGIIASFMIFVYFPLIKEGNYYLIADILGQLFGIWILIKIGFWIYKKIKYKEKKQK